MPCRVASSVCSASVCSGSALDQSRKQKNYRHPTSCTKLAGGRVRGGVDRHVWRGDDEVHVAIRSRQQTTNAGEELFRFRVGVWVRCWSNTIIMDELLNCKYNATTSVSAFDSDAATSLSSQEVTTLVELVGTCISLLLCASFFLVYGLGRSGSHARQMVPSTTGSTTPTDACAKCHACVRRVYNWDRSTCLLYTSDAADE